jgi:hypothetical protein
MTLTEFLLARIADDEGEARDAKEQQNGPFWTHGAIGATDEMIRTWTPERVLAECEAKRWIVDYFDARRDFLGAVSDVLFAVALPYAGHPDYQQEWSAAHLAR